MRIVGHGVDIVKIARIEREVNAIAKQWTQFVFTNREREIATGYIDPIRYFAGGFAAKEAVSKALGTGFRESITWQFIEILRMPSGKPTVVLTGDALQLAQSEQITDILISLSYTEELAIASAIAVGD